MQLYIDAHCHLKNICNYSDDLEKLISQGICGFICNAENPDNWDNILTLTQQYNNVYGCVGVHPWYIGSLQDDWVRDMQELLNKNSRLMIGEVGLDKNYPDLELQESIFMAQLELAIELNRPIHIHCVGAWDKMLRILKTYKGCVELHAFSASDEILKQLLKKDNVFFSYSAAVLDSGRQKLLEVVKNTPADRILVESDTKSPLIIIDIVKRIADIKSVAVDKIADTIYKNSLRLIENGQIS